MILNVQAKSVWKYEKSKYPPKRNEKNTIFEGSQLYIQVTTQIQSCEKSHLDQLTFIGVKKNLPYKNVKFT